MSRFLCPEFSGLEAYTPGEQPRGMEYIKLNTNESPYPPSPKVIAAVNDGELEKLRLYSDPEGKALTKSIADNFGLKPENVIISNGSDEALGFFFMAFCSRGARVVFPDISYGFYEVFAELYGSDYEKIPLKEDFSVNCEDYCGIGKNIVIANPNAPTGMSISLEGIEKMLVTNPDNLVLIDEAYVDFGGKSAACLLDKYENLVVVQTFSKSRSLAGARLGFALGSRAVIEDMTKMKFSTNPYNVNRLTLLMGDAAINDKEYFRKCTGEIIETRESVKNALRERDFKVLDSDTNFLFAAPKFMTGEEFYLALKEKGILVRYFNKERIRDFVRITIGTPSQMEKFIEVTDELLKGGKIA